MPSKAVEVKLEPVDNQRLARLCGALDENLRQIESALDVTIARRGGKFTVRGEHAQRAAQALEHFYDRASGDLTVEDVQLGLTELSSNDLSNSKTEGPQLLTRRSDLHGRTPHQVQYIESILAHDCTIGIGPAGTGKTYLAVACAVDALERDKVKRIVLARPAVEAGERLGFLPGDLAQKVDPYLRPLYDALYDLMGFEKTGKLLERGTIELAPLAYMRGRTLNHSFIILDEAQNTTPEQMKMFLTRLGFGSKIVVTGDITQIDLPGGNLSGLVVVRDILDGVDDVHFALLDSRDVVRHRLVSDIVDAYARWDSGQAERPSGVHPAGNRAERRRRR
jgi:phosphate starvation-inducible protein PhoH and related proteins